MKNQAPSKPRGGGGQGCCRALGTLRSKVLGDLRFLTSKNVVISGKTIRKTVRVYNFLIVEKMVQKMKESIINLKKTRKEKERKKYSTDNKT